MPAKFHQYPTHVHFCFKSLQHMSSKQILLWLPPTKGKLKNCPKGGVFLKNFLIFITRIYKCEKVYACGGGGGGGGGLDRQLNG